MAKQRRQNSTVSAIGSLLSAINKVAEAELGNVSPEQQLEANEAGLAAVQQATAIIGDSNFITAAEFADEDIDARITAEEEAEAAEAEQQMLE